MRLSLYDYKTSVHIKPNYKRYVLACSSDVDSLGDGMAKLFLCAFGIDLLSSTDIKSKMLAVRPPTSRPSQVQCTPNLLPCCIHHDGPANVTRRYWNPVIGEGRPCGLLRQVKKAS